MKTIYPIIILVAALSTLAPVLPPPNVPGPVVVAVHGIGQDLQGQQVSLTTNLMHGATNYTSMYKYTTTNFTVDADSLLALVEKSFRTNFPAGCQLLLVYGQPPYRFVVSDTTGTNIGFDPSAVFSSGLLNNTSDVETGTSTVHSTNSSLTPFTAATGADSFTFAMSFTYNDTAIPNPLDGTYTMFTWTALVHSKSLNTTTNAASNGFFNQTVTMEIIGGGSMHIPTNAVNLFDYRDVFTGSIQAKIVGFGD